MDNAGLQITISADVRDAILNLTDLTDATGELAVEGVGNLTAVNQALQALRAAQADTGNVGELQQLNRAIGDLSSQASQLKKAGTEGFDDLGNKINSVRGPAQNTGNSLQQLGLSTGQARVAFTDLGRIITGQGFNLRSIASNFALLGPAITIGIAAVGYLGEKLIELAGAYSPAQQATENLNRTLGESGAGALGEIDSFTNLVAIVKDTTNAYDLREKAFSKIQAEYPNAFQNLSLEKSSYEDIAKAADTVTSALLRQAQIRGLQSAISEQFKEIADESVKSGYEASTAFDKIKAAAASFSGGQFSIGSFFADAAGNGEETQQANIDKYQKSVKLLEDEMASLQKTALIDNDDSVLSSKKADDLKSIIPILEQIQRINDDLAKPSTQPLFKQNEISVQAKNPDSTTYQLLEAQIQEAVANGVTKGANDPRIASAYDQLAQALQKKLDAEQNPNLTAHFAFQVADPSTDVFAKMESTVEKLFGNKTLEIKVPTHLLYDIEATKKFSDDDAKKINEQLEKDPALAHMFVNATADIKVSIGRAIINTEEMQKTLQLIQKQIVGVAESGFKDIGELIGDALTGAKDPVGKAIKDFTTVLGNGLITIGEQMIAASTLMTLLKETLGNLFTDPIGGIVEGIAAVALGEVVKNVGAKAFATGGIITGPTLGLIGEAGPEVVFPLDRLNQFVKSNQGGGNQPVQVYGTIRGRDIAIASARDSKLQGMTS